MSTFTPKLFSLMKTYTRQQFAKDLIAGTIVAIIALPLSIALAIASGVSPEKGLHTAIIAGFLISFLGGSRVQIGGPTGAFVIIVYGILTKHGTQGLILATIMAGVFLIIMGVCRLGSMIKFIPYPITTGFTSGIALVIFSTQIKDFLGLTIHEVPSEFIEKWICYFQNIHTINWASFIIGLFSLVIIIYWPKVNRILPGSLIAIVASTIIAYLLPLDIETIGSRFGDLSSAFPRFEIPSFQLDSLQSLIQPAITIALLAAIESLLSAVVADGMIGGKHRSNMELVAQGVANIASGLFGGIPATGAIARTAANVKNGGRTPIAGIVHALILLLILLLFMPFAKLIPLSALGAILIMVAYNMSEWRAFRDLLKAPKSDVAVLLISFFLTVLVDLVIAIEIGVVLASLLFMKRMADVTHIKEVSLDMSEEDAGENSDIYPPSFPMDMNERVAIYEINGPFFFGAADKFLQIAEQTQGPIAVLILSMKNVPAMDATAIHALKKLYKSCKNHNIVLFLSEVQHQPLSALRKSGFLETLGLPYIFEDLPAALADASSMIA